MATVAWGPSDSTDETVQLGSPYLPDASHLIRPSDDFTVRLTTILKSILDHYGERMISTCAFVYRRTGVAPNLCVSSSI